MAAGAKALSFWDTLRVQIHLSVPAFLLGIVAPRRTVLWVATRFDAGRRTAGFLRDLRDKYGCEHLWLWFPFRRTPLVFAPQTMDTVLRSTENSPDPLLKKRAVSRFAPAALVISSTEEARDRRPFNTAALGLGQLHPHAASFASIAIAEVRRMIDTSGGNLRWPDFTLLGDRVSQQVILGEGQRDPALSRHLVRMVKLSNWLLRHVPAFSAFYGKLERLLTGPGPIPSNACLMQAAAIAHREGRAGGAVPIPSQVGFWFFVLKDAVELHVARTLALIAAHPEVQERARDEVCAAGTLTAAKIDDLRYVESCIVEQLRLWTPVPLLLRRVERPFTLDGGIALEAEEQMLIPAGFYHRDRRVFGELADSFSPASVEGRDAPARYVFSAHERSCAGQSLVLFVLKAVLAALLGENCFELVRPAIHPGRISYLYDHSAIELRPLTGASTGRASTVSRP